MKQIRWKSKAAWGVLIAQVVLVLALFFTAEQVEMVQVILMAIMLVAEAFGVFNNPTEKDHF